LKKFLFSFVALLFLTYLLLEVTPILFYSTALAVESTKYSISLLNIPVSVSENAFIFPNATMLVTSECNGLKPILLFISAIIAYPAKVTLKISWTVFSILFLQLINIIRITFLAWLLQDNVIWFDLFHDIVTPAILLMVSVSIFHTYTTLANDSLK